jgi:hypothetical protein
MHDVDVSTLKKHYEELLDGLRDQNKHLEELLKEKEAKVEF